MDLVISTIFTPPTFRSPHPVQTQNQQMAGVAVYSTNTLARSNAMEDVNSPLLGRAPTESHLTPSGRSATESKDIVPASGLPLHCATRDQGAGTLPSIQAGCRSRAYASNPAGVVEFTVRMPHDASRSPIHLTASLTSSLGVGADGTASIDCSKKASFNCRRSSLNLLCPRFICTSSAPLAHSFRAIQIPHHTA